MVRQLSMFARRPSLRTLVRCTAVTVGLAVVAAGCGSDDSSSDSSSVVSGPDSVAAAEARVTTAQTDLDTAKGTLTSAQKQFCTDATDYVTALDRYGKLFTDSKATVGDVKTGGADLVAPKESVTSSAAAIDAAKSDVAKAEQELADAQAALADAQAAADSVATSATTAAPTTTTTLVPPATITRVKQAETDLETAAAGITDSTPLLEATAAYNSAAFALEVAWLKLLADAGCLTDAQQAEAVAQVTAYTRGAADGLADGGLLQGPDRRHLRPADRGRGRAAANRQRPACHGARRSGHRAGARQEARERSGCRPQRCKACSSSPGTTPAPSTASGRPSSPTP